MGLEGQAFARDVIEGAPQTAVSDLLGIEELQRAGCGITRIGEGCFLLEDTLAVEPVESLVRHQYLAPDLELGGIVPVQLLRNVGNAPDVFGDIVADHSVAPRKCAEQFSVPVFKADGGSVELEFAAICEGGPQGLVRALRESLDLGDAVGVAEGKHGEAVWILHELAADTRLGILAGALGLQVASYPLGGGVRYEELGKSLLEVLELIHQVVILVVADDGGIVHVIPAAVVPDDLPELLYPFFRFFFFHNAL